MLEILIGLLNHIKNCYIKFRQILYRYIMIARVKVWNKSIIYYLEITNKITIIRGDSGTGKSRLIEYINLANNTPVVHIESNLPCKILFNSVFWKQELEILEHSIIFLDEDFEHLKTLDFTK